MAKKPKKQTANKAPTETQILKAGMSKGLREIVLLLMLLVAVYLFVALITFSSNDPPLFYSGEKINKINNLGGFIGAWIAYLKYLTIGWMAYLVPVILVYMGWLVFHPVLRTGRFHWLRVWVRVVGFAITVLAGATLASVYFPEASALPAGSGGWLGNETKTQLAGFGRFGITLILIASLLIGLMLTINLSWLTIVNWIGRGTYGFFAFFRRRFDQYREWRIARQARRERERAVKQEQKRAAKRKQPKIGKKQKRVEQSARVEKEKQVPLFEPAGDTELPPLALLDPIVESEHTMSEDALEAMSRQVELKLLDFGIDASVEAVNPGPVVTLYEIELAPGTKVSQVSNLAKDLARALSAISVRVVDVIPGKSVIGLEVPNEQRELITLSEILQSEQYDHAKSHMTIALGKDISGVPIVMDLGKMPHLLIAGTTGSGKSVAINAMVLSLIYKSVPRDVRLIMIDPKMLELSVYEGIPHLLTPVVTDMKDAANALRWCVAEMERRYRLMAALGVRNIAGFNRKVKDAIERGEPIPDPLFVPEDPTETDEEIPTLEHLPYIVVIIDELADMMMMVGKKVEELIARLAQKARAAGIHLILATQRPSVNVITGLIKANIPTRIAFQVSARVDSRTILDQMGAEQLLGHGDMLYLSPGSGVPTRVHGAFVSDHEVHRVVKHLKTYYEPDYLDEIVIEQTDPIAFLPGESTDEDDPEQDPLYDEAVRLVTESRRASISAVQRRLKIGYNRAARIMEAMEQAGIVSQMQGNGSREVIAPPPPE